MISMYYAGAAIALFAACQSIPLSTTNRNQHIYRTHLFLCVLSAIFLGATAQLLTAQTLAEAATMAKWQGVGAFGYLVSFLWLMVKYTNCHRQANVRLGLILYTLVCFAATGYHLTQPFGIFITDLELHGPVRVLGSEITHMTYRYRPQSLVFQALGFVSVGVTAWCCHCLWHQGKRLASFLFGSYLVFLAIALSLQLLYNFGYIEHGFPGGFTYFWLFVVISVCFGRDYRTLINTLSEQSEKLRGEVERRREAELRAREQAFTDELTGLPNHLHLKSHLKDQLQLGPDRLSLMLIQIRRFREIKQVFSEAYTDDLLLQIAERLKRDAPAAHLIARISETGFAVLTDHHQAYTLDRAAGTGRWREDAALVDSYTVGYQAIELNFNAGIIDLSSDDSAQSALYKAEHALDEASRWAGNHIVFYSDAFAQHIARQQLLEGDLKNAIAQNDLALHFQPMMARGGTTIVGVEVLLRWHHRELGPISPIEFIPLAERSGLMATVGKWVLEAACRQINLWVAAGEPARGRISINVSPWQLQSDAFADSVIQTLAKHEVDPHWITLEITETALVDNLESACRQLEKLRFQGIHIALDDFGTGFSSLSYLTYLPIDTLKIDKVFVDNMDDPKGRHLLQSMINLGKSLSLEVVIEGVETAEQFTQLKAMGGEIYQGYLFSRPLPPGELMAWASAIEESVPSD